MRPDDGIAGGVVGRRLDRLFLTVGGVEQRVERVGEHDPCPVGMAPSFKTVGHAP